MPDPPTRPARSPWLLAAALIAALFTLQSFRAVGSGPWGVDGSYYIQVARHVAEGQGLLTSVDIYNQGLRTLPTRTNIYPLWPLLLGYAARWMPLLTAATVVPRCFLILDLLLLFALARRLSINGFLPIVILGLTPSFFSATCYPYTEGLALGLCFGALLLADRAMRTGQRIDFALCGIVAGLAFLARSQMLLLGVALGSLLILYAVRRRVGWLPVATFFAGAMVAVMPWMLELTTFVRPFSLSAAVSMYSQTPALPPYDQHVITAGPAAYAADRLSGLLVMFNPWSEFSFVDSFGLVALLVPIAILFVLIRREWSGGFTMAAVGLSGALLCGVLLEAHNRMVQEWLFGYRHGLPLILLLLVAIAQLKQRPGRIVVAVLVSVSALMNIPTVVAFVTAPVASWPSPAERQLATWLARNDPNGIVLSTNAQALAVVSRANFRWATCEESPEDVARVLSVVRTDYVAVYEGERRCRFTHGLDRLATPLARFGDSPNGIVLLKVRP